MRIRVKNGFTLVELLVVIGIIAVLIAILLPALKRARQSAVAISCASNMRQVFLAESLYATDNAGWIGYMYSWNRAPDLSYWEAFIIGQNDSAGGVGGTGASFQSPPVPDYSGPTYLSTNSSSPTPLLCPAADPTTFVLGQCYGLNYDSVDAQRLIFRTPAHPNLVPQPGKPQFDFVPSVIVNMNFTTELPQPGFAAIVYARLGKAQNASTGAMLLDTVMPAQGAVQTDFTGLSNPDQQGGVWERDVVLRHGNNTANVAFWDGHVDRLGVGDFNNLGAKHILDANCNVLLGP